MANSPTLQIDFSKYRRESLAENIASIFSIPGTLKTILICGLGTAISFMLPVTGLFAGRSHWMVLAGVALYASFVSVAIGILLGVVLVCRRSLGSLQAVFDILFEISAQVSTDVGQMLGGSMEMPSTKEIFQGVYESVFLPTLEGVVRSQTGIFGGMVFWGYRWTLDRAVRRFLRQAPDVDLEQEESDPEESQSRLKMIESSSQQVAQWLKTSRQWVATAGSTMRRVIMVPLWFLLGLSVTASIVPIALTWFFT